MASLVGERVLEAFQQQHPGAFADHEPVGAAVERGAAAGRGERPQLAEPDLGEERIRPGHAAGQTASARPARSSSQASLTA